MNAVAMVSGESKEGADSFLAAAKTISKIYHDKEFYELALKALSA